MGLQPCVLDLSPLAAFFRAIVLPSHDSGDISWKIGQIGIAFYPKNGPPAQRTCINDNDLKTDRDMPRPPIAGSPTDGILKTDSDGMAEATATTNAAVLSKHLMPFPGRLKT